MASMLSPRNIVKFFSKNIEEITSPRIAAFMTGGSKTNDKTQSTFTQDDVDNDFGNYLSRINEQMKKHKANELRKIRIESRESLKEK